MDKTKSLHEILSELKLCDMEDLDFDGNNPHAAVATATQNCANMLWDIRDILMVLVEAESRKEAAGREGV